MRYATWHQKQGWKAEEYFEDNKVIALCHAIEKKDLVEMQRLIDAGADVNARGKGNMTPLLWAYPDNQVPRFKLLLENGADPNVLFESDFANKKGWESGLRPGDSITHMVCMTSFPGYFEAVFDNGGDPNLVGGTEETTIETPIFKLIDRGGTVAQLKELVELGANIEHVNSMNNTPLFNAIVSNKFGLALELVRLGADYKYYKANTNVKAIHYVAKANERIPVIGSEQDRQNLSDLIEWLEAHGESLSDAEADMARWASWYKDGDIRGAYQKKQAEVRARKLREAREKQQND
ncbi:MAG: hypothetical protein KDA79_07780 [Planctomycetaceae bacterium]|nr:hypothetical protein [Planctomycetaceae bacterium]